MLSSAQKNLMVTTGFGPGRRTARSLTHSEEELADEQAHDIQARMRTGPPERQPAWGERSPMPLERSRRLTRPKPAAAFAFEGGALAPGIGNDGGKAARGLGASTRPRSAASGRAASPSHGDTGGAAASGPPSRRSSVRPSTAGSASRRSSVRRRRRSRPGAGRGPEDAYVRRLEGQVAELRDTLSLLAEVNTKEVEAMAARRREARKVRRGPGPTRRSSSARRRRADGGKGGDGGGASRDAFAGRVADMMDEEEAHARVVGRLRAEEEESRRREEELERREAAAKGGEDDGDGEEEGGETRGATRVAAARREEEDDDDEEDEDGAGAREGAEGKDGEDEAEGLAEGPAGAEGVEDWADADEAWVRGVRERYLGKAERAGRWAASRPGAGSARARRRPASAAPRSGAGVKPRYMLSREEAAQAETTISRRKFEEERARLEAEEAERRRWRFRAKPVPRSTKAALYDKVVSQAATRRRLQHEARVAELRSTMKPFAGMQEGDARREESRRRREADRLEAEERQRRQAAAFRANPVPATTAEPDEESRAREEREAMRKDRVAHRAARLLRSSALPPRMELRKEEEAARAEEMRRRRRREDAESRRLRAVRPTPLPDFGRLQSSFEQTLQAAKTSRPVTQAEPFGFDGAERRAKEEAKAEARRRDAEDRLAAMMRRPDVGGQRRAAEDGGSDDGVTDAALARLRASVGGGSAVGGGLGYTAPPGLRVSMTRAAQLRMEARQREVRAWQDREAAAAEEEEARARRQQAVNRYVKPVVESLEAKRRPTPLAWQLDDDTPEALEARRDAQAKFESRQREMRDMVRKAEEERPMLFLRGSVDKRAGELERGRLSRVAKSMEEEGGSGGGAGMISDAEMAELAGEDE